MGYSHLNSTKNEDIRLVLKSLDRNNQKSRGKKKTDSQLKGLTAEILNVSRTSVYKLSNECA